MVEHRHRLIEDLFERCHGGAPRRPLLAALRRDFDPLVLRERHPALPVVTRKRRFRESGGCADRNATDPKSTVRCRGCAGNAGGDAAGEIGDGAAHRGRDRGGVGALSRLDDLSAARARRATSPFRPSFPSRPRASPCRPCRHRSGSCRPRSSASPATPNHCRPATYPRPSRAADRRASTRPHHVVERAGPTLGFGVFELVRPESAGDLRAIERAWQFDLADRDRAPGQAAPTPARRRPARALNTK